ncbi:MAG TPA: phage integrase N-terminal SAM-like domain-containing protein [Pyrinomonadaceae bacterium]
MSQSPLLDQVRTAVRLRHYSIRTEEAYVRVIRRFILYHKKRHPREMGVDEIRQYLSHLQPLAEPLRRHLAKIRLQHEEDVRLGCGGVYLPYALGRKYPNAATDWVWQYVFPAAKLSVDPRTGGRRRRHASEDRLRRAVKRAIRDAENRQDCCTASPNTNASNESRPHVKKV